MRSVTIRLVIVVAHHFQEGVHIHPLIFQLFQLQPQRLDPPGVLAMFLLISLGHFGKPGIIVFPGHIILILLPHFEYDHMAQPDTDQHQSRVAVRETTRHTDTAADLPVQLINPFAYIRPSLIASTPPKPRKTNYPLSRRNKMLRSWVHLPAQTGPAFLVPTPFLRPEHTEKRSQDRRPPET